MARMRSARRPITANDLLSQAAEQVTARFHSVARDKCLGSFRFFVEAVMKNQTAEPILIDAFQDEWFGHIDKCLTSNKRRIGIISMWGAGKSTVASVGFPLWLLARNPRLRIGIVCNTDSNASKRVQSCSSYIRSDPDIRGIFPDLKPDYEVWNDHRIRVQRDVVLNENSIEGFGIESGGTSARLDVLILDDICDEEDVKSPATREKRILQLYNVWLPRLTHDGLVMCIATRWHQDDVVGQMLNGTDWKFIVQAISDDLACIVQPPDWYSDMPSVVGKSAPKQIPLPPRMPREWLKDIRGDTSHSLRAFARGYQQRPLSSADVTFDDESIKACMDDSRSPREVMKLAIENKWPFFAGVDISAKGRAGSVITVAAVEPKGPCWVIDSHAGKFGMGPELGDVILNHHRVCRFRACGVESNGVQDALKDWMKRHYSEKVHTVDVLTGREKPIELASLCVEMRHAGWRIPTKNMAHDDGVAALLRELRNHPQGASDRVMSLLVCHRVIQDFRHTGSLAGFGTPTVPDGFGRIFAGDSGSRRILPSQPPERIFPRTPTFGPMPRLLH